MLAVVAARKAQTKKRRGKVHIDNYAPLRGHDGRHVMPSPPHPAPYRSTHVPAAGPESATRTPNTRAARNGCTQRLHATQHKGCTQRTRTPTHKRQGCTQRLHATAATADASAATADATTARHGTQTRQVITRHKARVAAQPVVPPGNHLALFAEQARAAPRCARVPTPFSAAWSPAARPRRQAPLPVPRRVAEGRSRARHAYDTSHDAAGA